MKEFKIRKVKEKVADRLEKFCLVRKGTITLKEASSELGLSSSVELWHLPSKENTSHGIKHIRREKINSLN